MSLLWHSQFVFVLLLFSGHTRCCCLCIFLILFPSQSLTLLFCCWRIFGGHPLTPANVSVRCHVALVPCVHFLLHLSSMECLFLLLFIFQKVELSVLSGCPVVFFLTCPVVNLSLFLFSILWAFADALVHAGKPCRKLVSNNFPPVLQVCRQSPLHLIHFFVAHSHA